MKAKHILLLLTGFLILFACQADEGKLPNEVFGVWKTSEPKYEGCFLGIDESTLTFVNKALPETSIDTNTISSIETQFEKTEQALYTVILYKKRGEKTSELSFYYYPHNKGIIRLKNQIGIKWVKTDFESIDELFKKSG